MFYKGLGNVIGISASMLIRTVTVKPIGEFLDILGAQDKHEHYLAAAKYLTEPETVIAQEISYSANYYTDSYMHKGDCDVKVITVCAGDYEERAALFAAPTPIARHAAVPRVAPGVEMEAVPGVS